MYKIILTALFGCVFIWGAAQPNNPYNQNGVDYIRSLELIQNDFASKKVREFNEATLRYYSENLPLKTQASVELVSSVTAALKNPKLNSSVLINRSTFSSAAKQIFLGLIGTQLNDTALYREYLKQKVNEVLSGAVPREEQEMVLTQLAIAYHASAASLRGRGCQISTPDYVGPASGRPCIVMGAVMGGLLGFSICGWWCALGGAIIGGVLGSLS